MRVIIAIPAYNEEKTLPPVLKEIREVMDKTDHSYQILVTDDGSSDKTAEVAKKHGAIVYSNKRNLGLAETFTREMQHCLEQDTDIIIHSDADGQYPAKYIPLLIEQVQAGSDLVLGSRFEEGSYSGSFMKRLGNKAFAKVISRLLKIKLSDTTTGFRAFTKEVAGLKLINTFTYTQEQIIRAAKAGMKISQIPIKTRKTRPSRLFSNPLQYALRAWINILRIYRDYNPLHFFGKIGLVFIGLGGVLGLFILGRIILLGDAGGIPRVILSMLLLVVGFQIMLFGFLADMNRK